MLCSTKFMLFHLCFSLLMMAAGVIDLKTRKIPPAIWLAIFLLAPLAPAWNLKRGLLGAAIIGTALLLPAIIKPGAFGGGDIKLVAACGFCLGIYTSLWGLLISFALSLPQCFYVWKSEAKQTHIAFAPYLAAGFIIATIFR